MVRRRSPLSGLRLGGCSPLASVVLLFWVLRTSAGKFFSVGRGARCQEQEEGPPNHIVLAASPS